MQGTNDTKLIFISLLLYTLFLHLYMCFRFVGGKKGKGKRKLEKQEKEKRTDFNKQKQVEHE